MNFKKKTHYDKYNTDIHVCITIELNISRSNHSIQLYRKASVVLNKYKRENCTASKTRLLLMKSRQHYTQWTHEIFEFLLEVK